MPEKVFSSQQTSLASSVLTEGDITSLDPLTILMILKLIVTILMFLGENWKSPESLPFWRKLLIRTQLVMKFGRKKGREIEAILYNKVANLTQWEVNGFVEV